MSICKFCGGLFEPNKFNPSQKYCSKKCKSNSWAKANPKKVRANTKRWNQKRYNQRLTIQKRLYYQNKQRALDYKGGCCRCGSKDSIVYHHLNPNKKLCNVTSLFVWKWGKVKVELDKCIPMCDNWHRSMELELRHLIKKLKKKGYNPTYK